jgi:hypothetical protein
MVGLGARWSLQAGDRFWRDGPGFYLAPGDSGRCQRSRCFSFPSSNVNVTFRVNQPLTARPAAQRRETRIISATLLYDYYSPGRHDAAPRIEHGHSQHAPPLPRRDERSGAWFLRDALRTSLPCILLLAW